MAVAAKQMNVFERAGDQGMLILKKTIEGKLKHEEAALILTGMGFKTGRSNVSTLVAKAKANYTPAMVLDNTPISGLIANLELEDINNKIVQVSEGKYAVDPLEVINHNVIRLEKLIYSGKFDLDHQVQLMNIQVQMAEKLAKIQPPVEDKIDYDKLFHKSDQAARFVLLLNREFPNLDIPEKYRKFIAAMGLPTELEFNPFLDEVIIEDIEDD